MSLLHSFTPSLLHFPLDIWKPGGSSHMKRHGLLVGKFEFNSKGRLMWTLLELQCTPKRYHLKQSRFDYQPVFKRESRAHLYARLAYSRDQRKSSLKTEIRWERFFHYYFFECTLKDTLTAKMVMFCHQHPKWDQDRWLVHKMTSIPDLTSSSPPGFWTSAV